MIFTPQLNVVRDRIVLLRQLKQVSKDICGQKYMNNQFSRPTFEIFMARTQSSKILDGYRIVSHNSEIGVT